jgi:hypothetical protein
MNNYLDEFTNLYHIEEQQYINMIINSPKIPSLIELFKRERSASTLLNIAQFILSILDCFHKNSPNYPLLFEIWSNKYEENFKLLDNYLYARICALANLRKK